MMYGESGPKKKRDWKSFAFQVILLTPAVAFLAIFMYYPIEETFRLSAMTTSGLGDMRFVGLENYQLLFRDFFKFFLDKENFFGDAKFVTSFVNVLIWAFWSVVIQIPIAFFVAFSLSAYKNKLTKPLRAVYYLANVLPSAITAMLAKFLFTSRSGVLDTLAAKFEWEWLARIDFLGDPNIAFWSVFAVATWAYSGFNIIYLMANIEQIPTDIIEAAELDGANRWQYAWYIVIPMVSYALRIVSILCIVGSMKLFDLPYLITTGGPVHATSTLGIMVYEDGFRNWQYGKAAAVGVIIFLLSLFFTVLQFSLQKKEGDL